MFTDPDNRARMVDWEPAARAVLSQFRAVVGQRPDARFAELVAALTEASGLARTAKRRSPTAERASQSAVSTELLTYSVELRHLRYFVTVATEMHFGRAARRLFVSQPALSQQIRGLEAEVGFKLFERNRRGVQLTPEGAAFLSEAEAVVQQADRAVEVARALAEGGAGHLRLSQLRTMPRGLPERITAEFQRRHPGVEIIPESGSTEQNVERLRTAQLDAAFVLAPIENNAGLACTEITTEPVVVALPTGHPLSRRRRIPRQELAELPLVFHPRHNSPGFYDSLLSQVYGTAAPNIVRTEPNEERMLLAVSEGTGITLLLADRTATLRFSGVVYRRFTDPEPVGMLAVAYREPPNLAARWFVELAREMAHTRNRS